MAPRLRPHRFAEPGLPELPPHQQLGFPTEEDLLDWLENQRPPRSRPRYRSRGASPLAWVAVGAATAAVVRALSRRGPRSAAKPSAPPVP